MSWVDGIRTTVPFSLVTCEDILMRNLDRWVWNGESTGVAALIYPRLRRGFLTVTVFVYACLECDECNCCQ